VLLLVEIVLDFDEIGGGSPNSAFGRDQTGLPAFCTIFLSSHIEIPQQQAKLEGKHALRALRKKACLSEAQIEACFGPV
jgi:hypothetical protein